MQLAPISNQHYSLWKTMRQSVYSGLSDSFHDNEMNHIINSDDWFSYFLNIDDNITIGFVELSARNIVDGCDSSPVAYIEGIYLQKKYRDKGFGSKAISLIRNWCLKNQFSELAADTELNNTQAQHFFQSVGFEETFRIVEFRSNIEQQPHI